MTRNAFTYKLLVEGKNDLHVIKALFQRLNLPETFEIIDCESVGNALAEFELRLKNTNTTQRLGIIVDADTHMNTRWESIKSILKKSGKYTVADELSAHGFILEPNDKEDIIAGAWIMPDNCLTGMLEDFISRLTPANDQLMMKADEILCEIESEGINGYNIIHHSKARIHTWLAWQEDPGTPMGQAITKMYLSTDTDLCRVFVGWLKALFVPAL